MTRRKSPTAKAASPSRARMLEWTIGGASASLLLALVLYLVYLALFENGMGPAVIVTPGAIEERAGAFHVRITAANRGGKAAAEVQVRGRLADARDDSSEVVFDYVPAGSSRHGTLVFDRDPRSTRIDVRVIGYREP